MTAPYAADSPSVPAPVAAMPDLGAIKQRQQATWASGDYHRIGTQIVMVAEQLIESLDVRSTERVLDVATGSGNAALAAARRGCDVVGMDYTPALLDRARRRAEAEALDATFLDGDAEALPVADSTFDVVSSVFGAMFAPDQEQAASELARATRPGGRIGLVAHTPDGFIGQMFKTIGARVPPPTGLASPILWGTEARLRDLFGSLATDMRTEKRHMVLRHESPEGFIDFWREYYGPTMKAFEAVGTAGAPALRRDLLDLIVRFNRADAGTMVVPSEYLEAVIVTQ